MVASIVSTVVAAVVTVVTLWIKLSSDRLAAERERAEQAFKLAEAAHKADGAAVKADAAAGKAAEAAVTANLTAGRTAAAVAEIKVAVDTIEHIREMVDGQRTAMIQELKTQTARIVDLERIIAAKDATAAAVSAKKADQPPG